MCIHIAKFNSLSLPGLLEYICAAPKSLDEKTKQHLKVC